MQQVKFFLRVILCTIAAVQLSNAQCDWSSLNGQVQHANCTGGNNGSITITGLPKVNPGTLYTCQQGTPVSGVNITVGPGEIKRLDVGANVNITINGGTLITCGSVSATTLSIANGGSLVANGSLTVYQNPVTIPSGCRIVNNNGSLYFTYPVVVNGGSLFNLYGSLTCASSLTNNGGIVRNNSTMYVNGGTYPVNYDPNNPDSACNVTWSNTSQTGESITNLAPGNYTATITCGSCSTTRSYTVNGGSTPTISITPSAPSICAGQNVSLTASGASTYAWSPATELNQTTGATVVSTPTASRTYTVTGTATGGCTGTKTVTISIKALPVVSVTPSSASICAGGNVSLTASGASTYSWSPSTGLNATTGATVTATPTATTTYVVTGTGTNGCTATKSVAVSVASAISVTVTPSASSICAGGSVSLTASGGTTYSWSPATGLSATTGATVTANPTTTTTYTVTGTTGSCTNTKTVVVTVNPSPTLSVTPSAPSICAGGNVSLTASGATTYSWSPATGLSATTGATVTANPTATTTYTVTGTTGSCTNTKTVVVTVSTAPTLSVTPSTPSICAGSNVSLTASGATTYSWSPATGLSATTGATVTANPTTTTTYTVTGTIGSCIGTNTVTVTVNALPVVTVTSSSSVCTGSSLSLTASGATTYSWSPSTGLSATTGATVTANPTSTTTYTVTGTSGVNCTATATTTITVKAKPTLTFTTTPSKNATTCTGTVTSSVSGGQSPYTYLWTGPNSFSSSQSNLQNVCPGNYSLTVTDAQGCSVTQSVAVESCNFNYTIDKVNPTCFGGNNGTITLTGLATSSNGSAYGTFYTCNDGTPVTGTNIVVGPGEVKRLDGSNTVTNVTINGGTLITCGATWISNQLNISNGGTLFCIGSLTCQPAVTLPAGCKIINLYQSMVFHSDVNVNGLLANFNGSVNTQTNLNISGKIINWTDFAATNFTVMNGGFVEHHGRWDSQWGTGTIAQGGSFKTYGNSTFIVKDFVHNGSLSAETGTQNCFKIKTSFSAASQGSVNTVSAAQLNLCSAVTIPSSVSVGSGVLTNNASTTCSNCTVYPPDPVDIGTLFGSSGITDCTVTWTGTSQTGASISGLTAGTYVATITCGSCTTTETIVLNNNGTSAVAVTSSGVQNATTGCNGTASVTVTGGQSPYTIEWLGTGQTGTTASNLCAGTYKVKATDHAGCTGYVTITINNEVTSCTGFSASLSSTNSSCPGKADGSLTGTVTGGTSPFTYLWSTGNTQGATLNNAPAGGYSLTVKDASGCSYTATGEIVNQSTTCTTNPCVAGALTGTLTKNGDSGCGSTCTGSATATATDGSGSYLFLWNGNSAPAVNTTLCPATYTVRVIDQTSKCYTDISNSIIITQQSSSIVVTSSGVQNATTGCNGTASVTVTGGQSPYTIEWLGTGQTGSTASNLCAGTYKVKATDQAGCTGYVTITINNEVTSCTGLSASLSSTNSSCPGKADGSLTGTVTGGVSPFTYLWSTGNTQGATLNNASAGGYSLTVKDASGCSYTATGEIINQSTTCTTNPCVVGSLSGTLTKNGDSGCGSTCTGSATATATGGSGSYLFLWNGNSAPAVNTTLCPATYTVRVIDQTSKCYTDISNSITINQTSSGVTITSSGVQNATTGCNGTASVTVTGGQSPYTIEWLGTGQTGTTASNLCAGTYKVKATDHAGCTGYVTITINNEVTSCTGFSTSLTGTNASCPGKADGSLTGTVTGGVSPFTYLWSTGNTQGATLNNAPAGGYSLTVKDASGCSYTATGEIVNQSTTCTTNPCVAGALTGTLTKNGDSGCGSTCTGSATATATGGSGSYVFLWNGNSAPAVNTTLCPATYTVRVIDQTSKCYTDISNSISIIQQSSSIVITAGTLQNPTNNNCNGTASVTVTGGQSPYTIEWIGIDQTSTSATNLCAGSYQVKVKDQTGCTSSLTVTLVNEVTECVGFNASLSVTGSSCPDKADGVIEGTVNGGQAPFTYLWNTGNSISSTLDNIPTGSYSLTVKDAKGCKYTVTAELTNQSNTCTTTPCVPGALSGTLIKNSDSGCGSVCTGSATATATGGSGSYVYLWNGNAATGNNTSLCPGTYTVRVVDHLSKCYTDISNSITISLPASQPVLTIAASQNPTAGNCDGTASVNLSGGQEPYVVEWLGIKQAGLFAADLCTGSYVVKATDNQNCSTSITINLNEGIPACNGFSVSLDTNAATCPGKADGSIVATVNGGVQPMTYLWSTGNTQGSTLANLPSGGYSLKVTDDKGCVFVATADIENKQAVCPEPCVPTDYNAYISSTTGSGCGDVCTGAASIYVYPETNTYTYLANGNTVSQNMTGLCPGKYAIRVIDQSSKCYVDIQYPLIIDQITSNVQVTLSGSEAPSGGECNGTATIVASGGTSPYAIEWFGISQTALTATNLCTGAYLVKATDNTGCSSTLTVTLNEGVDECQGFSVDFDRTAASCPGKADGSITAKATGGLAPFTYVWNNGYNQSKTLSSIPSGGYSVTVTDKKGCVFVASTELTNVKSTCVENPCPTALVGSLQKIKDADCPEKCNGSVTASATGGSGSYAYTWNGNPGPANNTTLCAGTYTVRVVDQSTSCFADFSSNVTVAATNPSCDDPACADFLITADTTRALCIGKANGSISLTIANSSGNYVINWSNGVTAALVQEDLPGGTYTVTVKDNTRNCEKTLTVILENQFEVCPTGSCNNNVSVNAVKKADADCPTTCTGAAEVTATGGSGNYKVLWNNVQGAAQRDNLCAGTYTIRLIDLADDCYTDSAPLVIGNRNAQCNPVCTTLCSPVTVEYNNLGQYKVSCDCSEGCFVIAQDGSPYAKGAWIDRPQNDAYVQLQLPCERTQVFVQGKGGPVITVIPTVTYDAGSCTNNGKVDLRITGGSGAYTVYYGSQQTNSTTISGLAPGNVSFTVVDNQNGASTSFSVLIENIPAPTATAAVISYWPSGNPKEIKATVTSPVSHNTSPYLIDWPALSLSNQSADQVVTLPETYDVNNNPVLTYTVKDKYSCSSTQLLPLTTTCPGTFVPNVSAVDPSCYGSKNGQLAITNLPLGAQLTWSGASTIQTSATAIGLGAGQYRLIVTQNNNTASVCVLFNGLFNVSNPAPLQISVSAGQANTYTAQASGGTSPITNYTWSNGTQTAAAVLSQQGTYTVTVTDSKQCTVTGTVSVIEPICVGTISIKRVNPTCSDSKNGSVEGSFSQNGYTQKWSGPGITNANNAVQTGLGKGDYLFTVDNGTCSAYAGVSLTQPLPLTASFEITDDQSVKINVQNGTAPYTISWRHDSQTGAQRSDLSLGTTYTVDITDSKGCTLAYSFIYDPCAGRPIALYVIVDQNKATPVVKGGTGIYTYAWSALPSETPLTNPTQAIRTGLDNGQYKLIVKDSKACKAEATISIPDCGIDFNPVVSDATCPVKCDGKITIPVQAGVTYLWDEVAVGAQLINACSGTHNLRMTTATGCAILRSVNVGAGTCPEQTSPCQNNTLNASVFAKVEKVCYDDNSYVDINVTGGLAPLTYSWTAPTAAGGTETYKSDNPDLENPIPGNYTLHVTDVKGCETSLDLTVSGPVSSLQVDATAVQAVCVGALGSATVNIKGGQSPYTVTWSDNQSGVSRINLVPGEYTATVTDAGGCVQKAAFNILTPVFNGNIYSSQTKICPGEKVTLSASTQNGYTYGWTGPGLNPLNPSQSVDVTQAGVYTFTYSKPGCTAQTFTFTLEANTNCNTKGPICNVVEIQTLPVTTNTECLDQQRISAKAYAVHRYEEYLEEEKRKFKNNYINQILGQSQETLNIEYSDQEGHYTLYYYDQAGNLVRTVPPAGVKPITDDQVTQAQSDLKNDTRSVYTDHTLATTYTYNSLNQLVKQDMPDHRKQQLWETTSVSIGLKTNETVSDMIYTGTDKATIVANNSTNAVFFNSTDGGKTWTRTEELALEDLTSIQQVDQQNAYAVGKQGTFISSVDGGINWLVKPAPTEEDLIKVHFTNSTTGRIMTQSGLMYMTNNSGNTWTSTAVTSLQSTIGSAQILDVTADGNTWIVTGKDSKSHVWTSNNNGDSWTEDLFRVPSLTALCVDAKTGGGFYGAGPANYLFRLNSFGETRASRTFTYRPAKQMIGLPDAMFLMDEQNVIYQSVPNNYESLNGISGNITTMSRLPYGAYPALINGQNNIQFLAPNFAYNPPENPGIANLKGVSMAGMPILDRTSTTDKYAIALGDGVAYRDQTTWKAITLQNAPAGVSYKDVWVKSAYEWYLLGTNGNLYKTQQPLPTAPPDPALPANTLSVVSGAVKSNIYQFYHRDNVLFVMNTSGTLQSTTDGSTWTDQISLPAGRTIATLTAFDFRNTSTSVPSAAATFSDGAFLEYSNNAWVNRSLSLIPDQLNGLDVKGTEAYAAGNTGGLYTKAGSSWNIIPVQENYLNLSKVAKNNVGLYVTNQNVIYRLNTTYNSLIGEMGLQGQAQITALSGKGNRLIAVGAGTTSGSFAENMNGIWANGSSVVVPTPLYAVHIFGDLQALMASSQGLVYRASGSGAYTAAKRPKALPLSAIASNNNSGMIAVGKQGTILTSSNAGANWRPRYTPITNVNFLSLTMQGNKAVAGADNGQMIYTGDAGKTWNVSAGTTASAVKTVRSANGTTVLAIAGTSVLKSDNNGASFTVDKILESVGNDLWLDTDGYGFIVGDNGLAYRITPSGNNFTYTSIATDATPDDDKGTGLPAQKFNSVYFHDRMTGYITGANGKVFKTTDGGAHWKTLETTGTAAPVLAFNNREQGSLLQGNGVLNTVRDRSEQFGSRFWYDQLGRMTLSQNAKQYNIENYLSQEQKGKISGTGPIRAYSYTLYDEIARITEVGELLTRQQAPTYRYESQIDYVKIVADFISLSFRREITRTIYDQAIYTNVYPDFTQQNLRSRVACVTYQNLDGANYDRGTHYSYDILGNVNSLVQEVKVDNDVLVKRMDYEYDMVSGKINKVIYQKGEADQLLHKYTYDADNRITAVQTSTDDIVWSTDAKYNYYGHGPLAKVELGENDLEIVNYTHTLQNWIKSAQGESYSFALGYNVNDYKSIGESDGQIPTPVTNSLYNGNIATMATDIPKFSELGESSRFDQQFTYDQLNRIKSSQTMTGDGYKTSYIYDPSGNITSLNRNDKLGNPLDRLSYHYEDKADQYKYNTNKLRSVTDAVSITENGEDLETQTVDNYDYDDIGNLLKDEQEDIDNIDWTVYGKVKMVVRKPGSIKPNVEFNYDALGERISKKVINSNGVVVTTIYLRDANGNTMAIYEKQSSGELPVLTEQHVYGTSRIGIIKPVNSFLQKGKHLVGLKSYELSDHLGNVSVTISDYKFSGVKSAVNNYPFGMVARAYHISEMRYGFNGQERDYELAGTYSAEHWQYDSRLGRRWNIDPEWRLMPGFTSYGVVNNNPITHIDPDGDFGFLGAIVGGIIGGVATTIKLAVAGELKFKDGAWKKTTARILAGVGTGALIGMLPVAAPMLLTVPAAGLISAGGDILDQSIANRGVKGAKLNWGSVAWSGALGAGGYWLGGALAKNLIKGSIARHYGIATPLLVRGVPRSIMRHIYRNANRKGISETIANRTADIIQNGLDLGKTYNDTKNTNQGGSTQNSTNNNDANHGVSDNGQNNSAPVNKAESVTVQLGAYENKDHALARQKQYGGEISEEGGLYKVSKKFDTQEQAEAFKSTVKDKDVWIKK